jgi:GT2 family glycosyltransferase
MIELDEAVTPWTEVVHELRRLRAESSRRDEDLWDALEEIRAMLGEQGEGTRSADRPAVPEQVEGGADRAEYRRLKRRLRRFVAGALPDGGCVAVVSRGDEDLLELPGCHAVHFPRQPGGAYTGFYPRDGEAAVAHLEWVRAEGADYLLFPETSLWWLEKFPRLAAHVEQRYPRAAAEEGVGVLYRLRPRAGREGDAWPEEVRELLDAWAEHADSEASLSDASLLDWNTGLRLASRLPGRTVFSPPRPDGPLPYLDGTVDVVAVKDDSPATLAEARRVARRTVVRFVEGNADGEGTGRGKLVAVMEHRTTAPPALPSASIVIPTFNGMPHLMPCLRALDETLPAGFSGEVVAVDDASGVETARQLRQLEGVYPWLRVLRNDTNSGFLATCNRGAQEARGDYVIFLNDDTVPIRGWLGSLLRTFSTHQDAGAVGGRLVFPDGRLQEAGGLVFEDASGANFGRNDYELEAPLYAHVRRVDYCSGALLATPRKLFLELGGFDTRYRPIYYEDTDYCFSVRRAGLEVYYQPEATVVHVEGATSGTDETTGLKRYQVRNRRIFRKKWREELKRQRAAPGAYTSLTWHRLAFKGGDR